MMGGDLAMDIANTRYMVSFGHNLYEGIEVADTHELMTAQEKGAKMVSFDPRLSVFSSKADEWHALKPGGDLPVLMAMCHVMINENLYDADFVARYTTGLSNWQKRYKRPRQNGRSSLRMCPLMLLSGSPVKWPPARLMPSSVRAIARRFRKKKLICGA